MPGPNFDWNRALAFLVAAETGSYSAAAKQLGVSQPTVGRQVAALEEELGVTLVQRVGNQLTSTSAGFELMGFVRDMRASAEQLALTAAGQSEVLAGVVSISASEGASVHVLPPVLARLKREAPSIELRLLTINTVSDLVRREADIALRHFRPTEADLVARRLRDTSSFMYASLSYLDAHGRPERPEDLAHHDMISFDDVDAYLSALQGLGFPVTRARVTVASSSHLAQWAMCLEGMGICVMSADIGDAEPRVERVLPDASAWQEPCGSPRTGSCTRAGAFGWCSTFSPTHSATEARHTLPTGAPPSWIRPAGAVTSCGRGGVVRVLVLCLMVGCSTEVPLASGVALTEVILGQNSGVRLVDAGEVVTERLQPVVADREARLRLRVEANEARSVEVLVSLTGGEVRETVALDEGNNVVQLDLPGDLLQEGATYAISLLEPDGVSRGDALEGARLPAEPDSVALLGVRAMPPLRVRLVSLLDEYGVEADTSEPLREALSAQLYAMFPVPAVELEVRDEPIPFAPLSDTTPDLTAAMEAVADAHLADGAPPSLPYLGFYTSLRGGGVAGSSTMDPTLRAAVAPVSQQDDYARAVEVAAHELGHLFGAMHAPCGNDNADPDYPHGEANLEVRVWNGLEERWMAAGTKDFMSYCEPFWVSPYSGGQIAEGLLWSW